MEPPATITLIVRRQFPFSAERVFDAWLDPQMARRFLFTTPTTEVVRCEIDARVGGEFVIVDRRPDNQEILHRGKYLTIDRPHHLVFSFQVPQFAAEEDVVEVTITPLKTGCELVLKTQVLASVLKQIPKEQMEKGWNTILGSLESVLTHS